MLVNVFIVMMLFYLRKIILNKKFLIKFLFLFFFFSWKVAGNLPSVDLHSFNKYLFQIMNHIQSIPFPESKHSVVITQSIEPEVCFIQFLNFEKKDKNKKNL